MRASVLVAAIAFALLLSLPAGPVDAETPHANFLSEFEAGADCPRLFDLRNVAKRTTSTSIQNEMNTKLRSVGCFDSTSTRRAAQPARTGGFTVKEYRIYRYIVTAPSSMSEAQSMRVAARRYGVTVAQVRSASNKVMEIISRNNWYVGPEAEIRHASDWKGEKQ